jgi:hypothetical protein
MESAQNAVKKKVDFAKIKKRKGPKAPTQPKLIAVGLPPDPMAIPASRHPSTAAASGSF